MRRHPVRSAVHPLLAATGIGDVVSSTTLHRFANDIASACDGTDLLRYSQRQRLLRRARCLGIRRFDANLIIAAVQHRPSDHRIRLQKPPDTPPHSWLSTLALFGIVQAVILTAGWWLLGCI